MSNDSFDPFFNVVGLCVGLDVVVPEPNSQVLHVILAHAEKVCGVLAYKLVVTLRRTDPVEKCLIRINTYWATQ